MDNLLSLGNCIPISLPSDDNGFTGRECPQPECEGYFKIEFGTGLKGKGLPCRCPYCGQTEEQGHFWTKEQIEFAKSVAARKITDALYKDLKNLEFEHKPEGPFGIGLSLKFEPGEPVPIRNYREKQLETEVVCANCTLHYSVYGVFAFCPDCGQHNSLQILEKNLELVRKILLMTSALENDLAQRFVENALEDCVSAFDGFGREISRIHAKNATDPGEAERIAFQNLLGARQKLTTLFDLDFSVGLTVQEWDAVVRGFQKRHLLSHKMGVVDEDYVRRSGDNSSVVGRKISLTVNEVSEIVGIVSKLARHLFEKLQELEART